jgi:hypothetical protein
VYFGSPGHDVPTDTFIGNVNLVFAGTAHPDRTLPFSNNSIDVLALPVPGGGGPAAYDRETLAGLLVLVLDLHAERPAAEQPDREMLEGVGAALVSGPLGVPTVHLPGAPFWN